MNDIATAATRKSVCVYCASSRSCDAAYHEAARRLGEVLAEAHFTIIYGGGGAGSMGALADGAISRGGRVIAQDAETSVVWGMPGAVSKAGIADAVLPLARIAPTIVDAVRGARPAVPTAAGGIR